MNGQLLCWEQLDEIRHTGLTQGNVSVKFNFLCSAYFWIPCTVQITKNIFLDFSSFTGVINARAKLRMNYSYYYIFIT